MTLFRWQKYLASATLVAVFVGALPSTTHAAMPLGSDQRNDSSQSHDSVVHALVQPLGTDAGFDAQWGLKLVRANEVWSISTGAGVTVAVIDSGSGPHPDLDANLLAGRTYLGGRMSEGATDGDRLGHGTHVAGIIAALANNDIGIAGVAPAAKILPIRTLDSSGNGTESDLALGIRFAVDQGARVINLSLGGTSENFVLSNALQYATDRDVLVVAAAGNDGPSAPAKYPASNDLTIAVTAIDQDSNAASFAQRGAYIDLAAPGVSVCSTIRIDVVLDMKEASRRCAGVDAPYIVTSGTSMSTAFVSGVAALVFAARPAMSAAQVREVLLATATDIGAAGRDDIYGAGVVNAYEVFRALGYFGAELTYPTVSSLGRVGEESSGQVTQVTNTQRLQWYRCATAGNVSLAIPDDCTPIARAVQSTYTPGRKDIGSFLRLTTLLTVGGVPQIRFSATTPRVTGVWTSLTSIQTDQRIPLKELVQSPSDGRRSARVISGPCRIASNSRLVAVQPGTCRLRLIVDARSPFARLANTVSIVVFASPSSSP